MYYSSVSEKLDSALKPLNERFNAILSNWICERRSFGATYPAFLVETYHYVKHSCWLMTEAKSLTPPDRVEIHEYWNKHIKEEVGHEEWALNDLEALGYHRQHAINSNPLPETAALIGSQMYLIRFVSPISLLGYAYLLETRPPTPEFLSMLRDAYSIPETATTFLEGHGEADAYHSDELREIVNRVVTTSSESDALVMSATSALHHINCMWERVVSGNFATQKAEFSTSNDEHMSPLHAYRTGNHFPEHQNHAGT